MSIFEHDTYELDYQRYLDWKHEQEEEQEQMEEYLNWEEARQNADDEAAQRYLVEVERERERETTGERIVREVANELSVIHEEDEVVEKQMAQITVDGVFRYDLYWLPETNEVRVEIDTFRSGEQMYYYYPDEMPIIKTLGLLMSCEEKDLKIEGLGIFGEGREDVGVEALPYEVECFLKSTWHDYAIEGFAVQFNINTKDNAGELDTCGHAEDDLACSAQTCGQRMTKAALVRRLEELHRNNHPTRHGLDGTQCDCDMCARANEDTAGVEPYHESVDEDRLPTVYECLNMPKRISDALIRNWVAKQQDEDNACSQAAELSETVRMIAGNSST